MVRYIFNRLLQVLLVILGVILFVFIVSRSTGDPVSALLGDSYTQEQYDSLEHEMGLDKPYPAQFIDYIVDLLHGDLGISYTNKAPIIEEVVLRFPYSLKIAIFSILWSAPLGMLLGMLSAIKQNSPVDYSLTTFSMVCSSMPNFWVALILMLFFSLQLKLLPATGVVSWQGYVLPCLASGLRPMAHISRLTRSTMLEVIRQDYVRTARSKGLSESAVILKHTVQNAAIPIVTQIASNFAVIVGGAAVIESIFLVPGLGNFLALSIANRDYPAVMGTVLIFSVFISVMNLLIDILYGVIDPRIKAKHSNTTSLKVKFNSWKLTRKAGGTVNG